MNVLQRIARSMSDSALVAEITKRSADLDAWVAEKFDVTGDDFRQERAVLAALRDEFRLRSGEVL